ncbi:hypothetical protein FHL15_008053 [Xylaria flabelliformis]|uniref:ER-bound oxygenase mpaB/mpaB'/Rubber oxygenase catalytic domain-containing protein n=1 Tax=Xylaria flabelliformis TaxID=2512241 RepID=A0A553HT13_9PEZI|nr:hypothetical protein FHL15_008053 [Xylaria flabelliformis]
MTLVTTTNINMSTRCSSSPADDEKPLSRAVSKEYLLSPNFTPKYMTLILQESILLLAGAAAILLQLAEPDIAAGVSKHSNFVYRVLDRLRTTMTFMYGMVYGTPEERKMIMDMITKIHSRVSGTLKEGQNRGKPYSALDPELQMWVAATLYATGIDLYQRVWGKIKDEQVQDNIYFEYSIFACSLQVPEEMWPASRKDFWKYWDHKIATVEVTQQAKKVCNEIMYLRHIPVYLRILLPIIRVCTSAFLPGRIRKEYGLDSHYWTYKIVEWLIKALYRPLPLRIRSFLVRFYLRDMRMRLASRKKIFEKA